MKNEKAGSRIILFGSPLFYSFFAFLDIMSAISSACA
jgi:hypothetical protein